MDNLRETVDSVIRGYAGEAVNGISYAVRNEEEDVWAVVGVAMWQNQRVANSSLIVRLMEGKIVVERDMNSKPLYEALLQAGIPREKIVLAYAGEEAEVTSAQ
jgi:hypothetical protein